MKAYKRDYYCLIPSCEVYDEVGCDYCINNCESLCVKRPPKFASTSINTSTTNLDKINGLWCVDGVPLYKYSKENLINILEVVLQNFSTGVKSLDNFNKNLTNIIERSNNE